MYSSFLTASPGSVLFSRSTLLKRKDLCFSCLRLGLIRHRRSKKPHTFSQSTRHDFLWRYFEPTHPLLGVRPVASSLSASLFTVSQSAPDLSLIFLESLEHFIELYLVNCILELLLSILSKRFRCSNESNQKAIRDRSSKVEIDGMARTKTDCAHIKKARCRSLSSDDVHHHSRAMLPQHQSGR